ncbi:Alpha/Beta hydrolase protein [Mycena capillaripes]|nr:Alpha/Beta hydrolase protein [Mycena capillaripes]
MALLPGGRDYALPRPGSSMPTDSSTPTPRIAAPSEAAFTSIFGTLLPPAKFLTTPHGRTAFYDFPPASPSPIDPISRVIMIHGVCTPALGLLPLASTLLTAHPNTHLVLYDLWGHSLSDTPAIPHTPALFHAQLLALLVHLGWADAPVNVVGYSFGGAIAAVFAARYPETVKSLVLVAPAGLMRAESFGEPGETLIRGGDGVDEKAARDWVLHHLEGGPLTVPTDWQERVQRGEVVPEKVRGWQQEEHPGHVASCVAIFRDGGAIGLHEEFTRAAQGVPHILAILGELDEVCSKEDLVAVGVQLENVVVVEGVGHGLVRQRVGAVARPIGGFWEGLGLVSSSHLRAPPCCRVPA